uniref:Uncharacterized protein n=1 Tax=Triticum urartu TaxID=4572 RepID=A0A8R7QMP6_TRIUA
MGSTWVEHRGSWPEHASVWRVNRYVINMLGKAVMVEQTEKERLNLLLQSYWSAYYVECDIARLFQKAFETPMALSVHLTDRMIGFQLDRIDIVFL